MTAMAWLLPSLEAGLLSEKPKQGAEKEGPAHSSPKIGARLPKKLLFLRDCDEEQPELACAAAAATSAAPQPRLPLSAPPPLR